MSEIKTIITEQLQQLQMLMHRTSFHSFMGAGKAHNPHRGQGRVLAILKMKPEISQRDLTYLLGMSKQSIAQLLDKLEKSGYITREPSEEDKKAGMPVPIRGMKPRRRKTSLTAWTIRSLPRSAITSGALSSDMRNSSRTRTLKSGARQWKILYRGTDAAVALAVSADMETRMAVTAVISLVGTVITINGARIDLWAR